MVRTTPLGLTLALAVAGASTPAGAQRIDFDGIVTIPAGETRQGDLYAVGASISINGRLAGDLVAAGQRVLVDGQVDGDLFVAANAVDLRGPVGDSTRVAAQRLSVTSEIDGDLIAAATVLHLADSARITGRLVATGTTVEIDGTVDDDLRVVAGEIIVRGTLTGDANFSADRIELAPGARIAGNLDYRARVPLSPEAAARVAGAVRRGVEVEEDEDESGSIAGSILFWSWWTGAALFTGILAIALFRRGVQQLVTVVAGDATAGALLGFAAFLIIPIAAVVAMVTLIGLPVGIAAVLLFAVALYAAKLPIAVWAGGRLLALAGRPNASPYAAMAIGIVVLYAAFATPYVGWLIWLIATWLGLGAMVLAGRRYLPANDG